MQRFKRMKEVYVRFVEKQGFPIIVTVCVAVITATALWTEQQEETWVAPTPPVSQDVSAAQLMQQSLRQAATSTPAPTSNPTQWLPPLEQIEVLTPFLSDRMIQSSVTGIWAIHDALDLAADRGSKVRAMADGVISGHGYDHLKGVWVQIDHDDGVTTLYTGMALCGDFITGDEVRGGDVIGYTGNELLDESDLAPHLHLRVTQDGTAIDPSLLWNAN